MLNYPMTPTTQTPAVLGFAMPAEWDTHAATWMGWPFDDDYWLGYLEVARQDFTQLIRTIADFESVIVTAANEEAEQDAKNRLGATANGLNNIRFRRFDIDDIWFRDSGPIFIRDANHNLALTDWGNRFEWKKDTLVPKGIADELGAKRFEVSIIMEGGALEINSQGVLLTTKQCLLNKNRNPKLSQAQIEQYLKDYLGVKQFIWLERGLEGDRTDGHIDTITRFANDTTIITSVHEDKKDTNYAPMQENLEILKNARQPNGDLYNLVELPLPRKRMDVDGERLPMTYANFYIGNGFVVVPTYDDANDNEALCILQSNFPDHKVLGLNSTGLITGGGSFHCVTQQQPIGKVTGER
jgi:agmatine deiminase